MIVLALLLYKVCITNTYYNNWYFPRSVNHRPHFLWIGTFVKVFSLSKDCNFRVFLEKKITIQKYFWVFYNDSLGINYVDSYDGCLQFWRKSWPTGEKCDFKNITSDMHRIEKILQVREILWNPQKCRFFEEFFTGWI